MKRFWAVLLCLAMLGGCSVDEPAALSASEESRGLQPEGISGVELLGLGDAAVIEIYGGDAWGGASVDIHDPEVVKELTDMVGSLVYVKGEKYVPVDGCGYHMGWYDEEGTPLAGFNVGENTILFDDYYYDIVGGRLNVSRLDELLRERWPFHLARPAWAVLRDETSGASVAVMEGWPDVPVEKAGPAQEGVEGYTLELYDNDGEQIFLLEHITSTGFCMDGSAYTALWESGMDVEHYALLLAASQGDEEALAAFDVKAVTIDNKEKAVYIEDQAVIKEVIAMFADMEIMGSEEAVAFPDYDYEIHFIEGFSEWSLYGFSLREDGTFLWGEKAYTLSGSRFDPDRMEELVAGASVERVFPENYLYFHDIDHIELTGLGKTVEIEGENPLSYGMDGSSLAVMNIFRDLRVERAGPAEESTQEVYYTLVWVDGAGEADREISICADNTLLYDGYVHNVVYGGFDTWALPDLLEGDGKLPAGSPQPTASAQP